LLLIATNCDGEFEREGGVSDEISSGVLGDKETDIEWLKWRFLEEKLYGEFLLFSYNSVSKKNNRTYTTKLHEREPPAADADLRSERHRGDCDGEFEREGNVPDEISSGVLGDKETDFEWLCFLEEKLSGEFPFFSYNSLSKKNNRTYTTKLHDLSLFCSRSHTCVPM
jgi:hypothetical protein